MLKVSFFFCNSVDKVERKGILSNPYNGQNVKVPSCRWGCKRKNAMAKHNHPSTTSTLRRMRLEKINKVLVSMAL